MRLHLRRLLIVSFLFFIAGCFTNERKVTKQEALDFAKNLEASVAEENPNVLNNLFDAETFKKRIKEASGGRLSDSMLAEIPLALKKKRIGDEVVQSTRKGGMYQLVKSYEKEGKQRLIFRLYGSTGINYHDIELIHAGDEIKAADMYIYLTGENFSKSLADVSLQMTDYYDVRPGEKDFVKSAADMKKFIDQEKYVKALSIFESLPDTLKKQKLFQIRHVQITAQLGDTLYQNALAEYEKLFSNEPGMYILFMNVHISHKQYEKALEDVNKMDSLINKDPFLDYYRGLIYQSMEKDTMARMYFERLYKNMPAFGEGIIELIELYAKKGETQKAKALVKIYKNNKKLNQESLDLIQILYPALEK
jgi:hypothetical protein